MRPILPVTSMVCPGDSRHGRNVHDSVAFDDVYDKLTKAFPEVETVVADSAYKTPHICKKVFDDGRFFLQRTSVLRRKKAGTNGGSMFTTSTTISSFVPSTRRCIMRPPTGKVIGNTRAEATSARNVRPDISVPIPRAMKKR